jgi:hypothetical protein
MPSDMWDGTMRRAGSFAAGRFHGRASLAQASMSGSSSTPSRAILAQSSRLASSLSNRQATTCSAGKSLQHILDDELQGRPPAEGVAVDRERDVPRRIRQRMLAAAEKHRVLLVISLPQHETQVVVLHVQRRPAQPTPREMNTGCGLPLPKGCSKS